MLDLNFTPFPHLSTDRLILRDVTLDDADEMFIQRSDPTIGKYINRALAENIEVVVRFIGRITEERNSNKSITWAIVPKGESRLIGTVCFWNIDPDKDKAELGYSLHPDYFGKGIMTEALSAILAYGFKTLKFQRIDAFTHKDNGASLRLLTRTGFTRNIALEHEFAGNDELEHDVIYSCLNLA